MAGQTVMTPNGPFTLARSCDGCTLCCKVMEAAPIGKPAGTWCTHCIRGVGCGIHETRAPVCREYHCGWLIDGSLSEEWRPERAHLILTYRDEGRSMSVHVDEDYPDAWLGEPYYSQFKRWAALSLGVGGRVMAYVGDRGFVVLPDRHVALGLLTADDFVFVEHLPNGQWDARKVGHEEAAALKRSDASL